MANKGQLSNRAIKRELARKIASEAHNARIATIENKVTLPFKSSSVIDVPSKCKASKNELHYNKSSYYYVDFQLLTFDRAKPKRKIKTTKVVVKKINKKETINNEIITKQVNQISIKSIVKFDIDRNKKIINIK